MAGVEEASRMVGCEVGEVAGASAHRPGLSHGEDTWSKTEARRGQAVELSVLPGCTDK